MDKAKLEKRYQAYRDYKAEGHSLPEVAEHFGISEATASKACKGIARQPRHIICDAERTKGVKNSLPDREAKAIETIKANCTGFEYVGGYKNTDSRLLLRCLKCGEVAEYSFSSIRHGNAIECDQCKQNKKAEEKERKRMEAERIRAEKAAMLKTIRENKKAKQLRLCVVCGNITDRKKYCCPECLNKAMNARSEIKRRIKIQDALVDKDINIESLFDRDKGVCHICGEYCNWYDYTFRGNNKICGNYYPSIDHVIPLSKGGKHSWENVRLAHRICNTKKGSKVPLMIPLPSKMP